MPSKSHLRSGVHITSGMYTFGCGGTIINPPWKSLPSESAMNETQERGGGGGGGGRVGRLYTTGSFGAKEKVASLLRGVKWQHHLLKWKYLAWCVSNQRRPACCCCVVVACC